MMSNVLDTNPRTRYFNPDRTDMRFKRPGKCKTFRIAKLWDRHHEICRRLALGEKSAEIANDMGISPVTVSYTKNSKLGSDQISIIRGAMTANTIDLGRRIQEFAPKALELLESVIKGEGAGADASIGLRARHADKYLDRAGYSPVRKVASIHATLTKDEIEAIKERSRQSALEAGIIDIEPEELDD